MDKTFIIAEAGVNHNGDLEMAKKLVEVAAQAGADAVKFQTFTAEKCLSRFAPKAEYQVRNTGKEESQLEMVRKLELSVDAHHVLARHARACGIHFMSTAFDLESVDLLASMGMEVFKIPSGEITNLPLLRKFGGLKKRFLLSTGMARFSEIEAAIDVLVAAGADRDAITVLHCNTEYPTPMRDVNLRAMHSIRDGLRVDIGYSDHTNGIEIAIAAVALGAKVIEKHFTLDRNLPGPDHIASLEPDELKEMVRAIRNIELALGDGRKRPSESEVKNIPIARRSIVAAGEIRKGEIFTEKNLAVKRPGTGISPMLWDTVLGRPAPRDFQTDEMIEY